MDGLKTQRAELTARVKDVERELERSRGESEVLRQKVSAAENEHALQRRFVENANRQAELVTAFLGNVPGRGGPDFAGMHEELGALTVGGSSKGSGRGGYNDFGGGGGQGGPSNMPYSAANASVFRSIPGI